MDDTQDRLEEMLQPNEEASGSAPGYGFICPPRVPGLDLDSTKPSQMLYPKTGVQAVIAGAIIPASGREFNLDSPMQSFLGSYLTTVNPNPVVNPPSSKPGLTLFPGSTSFPRNV